MRFMVLQNYNQPVSGAPPIDQWSSVDFQAHIDFQIQLNQDLTDSGELVDAQGLAGPDQAKVVTSDGINAPVVTDGPFPESKELLAGYRLIDVDTFERAVEVAGLVSAAPGPNGVPIQQPIELRQVMSAPDPEV